MAEKGGGRCPSGGSCVGSAGGSDQGAQQADQCRKEGWQDACGQEREGGGSDHDEHQPTGSKRGQSTLDAQESRQDQAKGASTFGDAGEVHKPIGQRQAHLCSHHFNGGQQLHAASKEKEQGQQDLQDPEGRRTGDLAVGKSVAVGVSRPMNWRAG
jgi:hypothetical protein